MEPLGLIRRWPTTRSRDWTVAFLNGAPHDPNILAVVAIGSSVRPAVRSVDLDLVIVCNEPAALALKPPLEVDLRTFRADRVERELEGRNDLLGWSVKLGKVLWQRDGYWDALVASWRHRVPLPSRDLALTRARDAFGRLTKVVEVGDLDAAEEQAVSYVTHLARAELLARDVYPASRPELPEQLRQVGADEIANLLERLIDPEAEHLQLVRSLVEARGREVQGVPR
jgi:hypothetical protein